METVLTRELKKQMKLVPTGEPLLLVCYPEGSFAVVKPEWEEDHNTLDLTIEELRIKDRQFSPDANTAFDMYFESQRNHMDHPTDIHVTLTDLEADLITTELGLLFNLGVDSMPTVKKLLQCIEANKAKGNE